MQSKKYSGCRYADAGFTFAIKRQMRDIVSLFQSNNALVLSVDGKALALMLLQNKLH